MLSRIIFIKNVGRFRNSAAAPNPQFGKQTLVFAPNGYGKTTLCAILRSLQSGNAAHLLGRKTIGATSAPEVELRFEGASKRFEGNAWSGTEPRVSIFDGVFVAENVHSGDVVDIVQKRNLYRVIVGSAGVDLARREQDIAELARAKQAEITAAERALTAFAEGIPVAMFLALTCDDDINRRIEDQTKIAAACRQADAIRKRPSIALLAEPTFPAEIRPLIGKSLGTLADNVEVNIREHFAKHGMERSGERWIATGMQYTRGDACPFCGRDGIEALQLFQGYKFLFSEAYASLQQEVQHAIQSTRAAFGDRATGQLRTQIAQNETALEFWGQYCEIDRATFPDLADALRAVEDAHERLQDLLERKADRPLETPSDESALNEAERILAAARDATMTYNNAATAANKLIAAQKEAAAAGDLSAAETTLAQLKAAKRRKERHVSEACDTYTRLVREKEDLEKEKCEVRAALENHSRQVVRPYEDRINHFLGRFNAGFRIARTGYAYPGGAAASTYQLSINNQPVEIGDARTPTDRPSFKNTLSAGDRTTLALAFFLAGIERESDLAERIVVFDDPFSSHDAFRRQQTVYEIMRIASQCKQAIVLSHDSAFLKQLWDKCDASERAAVQIVYHAATGSKINSFDLDDACRGRARAELDDLMTFRATGAGNLRDIIKKLRTVLETHFRSAYPGCFGPDDNCGEILRKIREGRDTHPAKGAYDDLERINGYTADYHHGEDARGASEPPLDRDELLGFVEDTLRIVNALSA